MNEVLKFLGAFSLGGAAIGGFAFYVFKHPELLEKWLSIIYNLLSYFNKSFKYLAAKNDIQSKINSYVATLSKDLDIDPTRVKIKWAAKDDQESVELEDNEVIIVLRDKGYKNKNFVHAAYFYTSTMLLASTKRHLSKKQGESLDIYTTKKVIERSNSGALELFMREYFQPLLEDDKIKAIITDFVTIDKSGMYTHVLLQELSYLGAKTFLTAKNKLVMDEMRDFIKFLVERSKREVGDVTGQEEFIGRFSRCSIKIVSTRLVRETGQVEKPAGRILKVFRAGIENVYVMGPQEDGGQEFMDEVCKVVLNENPKIVVVKKDKFTNIIISNKVEKKNKSSFMHLQNPEAANYLVDDSMTAKIESLEQDEE